MVTVAITLKRVALADMDELIEFALRKLAHAPRKRL